MLIEIIKNQVFKIGFLKKYYIRRKTKYNEYIRAVDVEDRANLGKVILLKEPLKTKIKVGLVRDAELKVAGFVKLKAYHYLYERFLKNNSIDYEIFDIHKSDWVEQAKKFQVVVWRTASSVAGQREAEQKIFILENIGIQCFPSFKSVFKYEDKVLMHFFYKSKNLPEIPTFVSHSKEDALLFAEKAEYPIVSKITTGSSSNGVQIIRSRDETVKYIEQVFSKAGRKTYWKYQRHKNYVYFQKFIDDASFDLRVIVVGDSLFGYYRYPKKGDFRASGAGNVEKKAIPFDALDLAWDVKQIYNAPCLATDFVYSEKDKKYYIIENSIFISVETPEQLWVNGTPGRYIRKAKNQYEFEEGKFWIQELALKEFFEHYYQEPAL